MATITEDYVSFETAKLLKEKGFSIRCKSAYWQDGTVCHQAFGNSKEIMACTRPTQQMAMKWLREVHKLGVFPSTYTNIIGNNTTHVYGTAIVNLNTYELMTSNYMARDTYEEACEAAIRYCLEHLI